MRVSHEQTAPVTPERGAGDRRVPPGKPRRERPPTRPEELHTAGAGVLVLDVKDTRFDSSEA